MTTPLGWGRATQGREKQSGGWGLCEGSTNEPREQRKKTQPGLPVPIQQTPLPAPRSPLAPSSLPSTMGLSLCPFPLMPVHLIPQVPFPAAIPNPASSRNPDFTRNLIILKEVTTTVASWWPAALTSSISKDLHLFGRYRGFSSTAGCGVLDGLPTISLALHYLLEDRRQWLWKGRVLLQESPGTQNRPESGP